MSNEAKAKAGLCAAMMVVARNLADSIQDEDIRLAKAVRLLELTGTLVAPLAGHENLVAAMETVSEMMAKGGGE